MERHSIVLRAANPTFDEGLAFARYADQAAEGFFRFMLGRRAGDIIATAFARPDHDLSYQNVTFAERDNVIVGMTSGYTAEQHRRSSLRPLKRAAGRGNLRMRIVLILFAPLMRIIDSIADGDFYLGGDRPINNKIRPTPTTWLAAAAVKERPMRSWVAPS